MQHAGRLMRSARLSGYAELVRTLGADPDRLLHGVGLSAAALQDPETLIPGGAVRELLEATARATGADDFALRRRAGHLHAGCRDLVLTLQPSGHCTAPQIELCALPTAQGRRALSGVSPRNCRSAMSVSTAGRSATVSTT